MYRKNAKKENLYVRIFEITDPTQHKKGYTVYKVTSRVFPANSFEATTQIVVWKRYNDFKKLHKSLCLIHQNLHLKGNFPPFAKARFFGRYAQDVIEERRVSALALLEFASQFPALYNSQMFVKFFEDGQQCDEAIENIPEPLQPVKPLEPVAVEIDEVAKDNNTLLGGIWKHPISAEVISLNSQTDNEDDDHTTFTDDDSMLNSQSLDIRSFECSSKQATNKKTIKDSWFLSSLSLTPPKDFHKPSCESPYQFPFPFSEDDEENPVNTSKNSSTFHPDVTLLEIVSDRSSLLVSNNVDQRVIPSPQLYNPSYLCDAADTITKANYSELKEDYRAVFSYYKQAVDILLKGVEGEPSQSQRNAVKKKVTQYLNKAEDIYNTYLNVNQTHANLMWSSKASLPVSEYLCKGLRGKNEDLKNYKVVGVLNQVLLVLDVKSNTNLVLKVYHKSISPQNVPNIVPQDIPFMVKLHQVYETDYGLFLVLQYASGGRLWDYISSYIHNSNSSTPRQLSLEPFGVEKKEDSCINNFVDVKAEHSTSFAQLLITYTLDSSPPGTQISPKKQKDKGKGMLYLSDKERSPSSSVKNSKDITKILEHMDNLTYNPIGQLPEASIKMWAAELVMAVSSLHVLGLIIQDLNPDNILLGEGGHVLISYQSRWNCVDNILNLKAKEYWYLAPEVISRQEVKAACDWWSVGAVLYELITGSSLQYNHPGGITAHTRLYIPTYVSSEARDLLSKLLKYDQEERLGCTSDNEVKKHSFFIDIDWTNMY